MLLFFSYWGLVHDLLITKGEPLLQIKNKIKSVKVDQFFMNIILSDIICAHTAYGKSYSMYLL